MGEFEDWYEILEVSATATLDEIKESWIKKSWIYGSDRMNGAPDDAKKEAAEKHKKINQAYDVLTKDRKKYDREWRQWKSGATGSAGTNSISQPKPTIDPYHIEFKNAAPGEVKKASFTVFNTGGPYSKININNPDSWLRVVAWHSLSTSDELPLKVEIEAQGKDWYKRYSDVICISLDNAQARVNVLLTTRLRLEVKDHKWHDIDFENLKAWVKKRKDSLDTGQELPGKTFRYRLNKITHKYQFRLRHSYKSAIYDPYH